ncbi:hypothetical protein Pan216_07880 [Planctomycetes bacterium Pan216]|uniref:ATP-dependent endonuclease n=1 Tax=Kolteria novifilia TaxID=2527975 RepID=A0A518AZ00_9BACT|nr:hypothetical protein Pan216_07880 [Planctomycetes bacterium Pan216]
MADNSANQCVENHSQLTDTVRVILVVEGSNDIEFLRRIARVLHEHDTSLPDLADLEQRGVAIFLPFGGGNGQAWTHRLEPLHKREFHLLDRELPPETDVRREAADAINRRDGCRAELTRKRSLENYLHPEAILAAGNIEVSFGDFDPVAEITGRALRQRTPSEPTWENLSRRARSRVTHRAKRWLNTVAANYMTVAMLRERDPEGEVISWMNTIGRMIGST